MLSLRFCADPRITPTPSRLARIALAGLAPWSDLVLFRKFPLTGWTYDLDAALELDPPGREPGPFTAECADLVHFGPVDRAGSVRYNSFVIERPAGIAGVMTLVNLTPPSTAISHGPGTRVIEVPPDGGGVRLGVTSCTHATHSEMVHLLSLRGAEVILGPHARNGLRRNPRRLDPVPRGRWPRFRRHCAVAIAGVSCAGLPHRICPGWRPRHPQTQHSPTHSDIPRSSAVPG